MESPELLCPAGDFERLQTAIRYGADAVYLGSTQFGMRAAPSNFTMEQLAEAANYAHARGVKLHLTVNTLPRCDETATLPEFLAQVGQTGIEYSMEDQLTPYITYRPGKRGVEVNNRGKVIREISYQAPLDGNDVILTIDTQL